MELEPAMDVCLREVSGVQGVANKESTGSSFKWLLLFSNYEFTIFMVNLLQALE